MPDTETEAPPARKRRTSAEVAADKAAADAALEAAHDSDTIPTPDLLAVLRDWQTRHNACDEAERILQRNCGLKFVRVYDYDGRRFDNATDRFAVASADSPTEIPKIKIARAIRMIKRSYGANGYGVNWLETQLDKKFGLTVKEYNDTYTLNWTFTLTAKELIAMGWDGAETAAVIGESVRYNGGVDWRKAELTVTPDPERAADAAKRAAAKAAAAAVEADKTAGTATPEPTTETTPEVAGASPNRRPNILTDPLAALGQLNQEALRREASRRATTSTF